MRLLLLDIDSEVEQLITELTRQQEQALGYGVARDVEDARSKVLASECDTLLLSASALAALAAECPDERPHSHPHSQSACHAAGSLSRDSGRAHAPGASLLDICRRQGTLLLLVIADLDELRSLEGRLHDAVDDFIIAPYDPAQISARIDLLRRRRRVDSLRRALLRTSPDQIFQLGRDGSFLDYQLPDATRLCVAATSLRGARLCEVLPADTATRCHQVLTEALEAQQPRYFEFSLDGDSATHHFEARLAPCGPDEVLALIRDVTERKQADDKIRAAVLAKQAFASRILGAQEAERQHLSRELHDSIGQLLLVHRLEAEWLANQLEPGPERDATEHLCTGLDETLHLVRTLAMDLRPPAIDDLGIESALETLCVDLGRRAGVRCEFENSVALPGLRTEIGVTLYRIAQEALANAARHSGCRTIRVVLAQHDSTLELSVSDDGVGIAPERLADDASFGLISMRERAELIGGHVSIRSSPKHGTHIRVAIPHTQFRTARLNTLAVTNEGEP
ncbi:ATP-binding protein [Haliangium ochraceum]|uniref:Oxygen sensor histidine kinase NreB n=1 Tax=Haliangium ochraceum (strain DSM 14365 / JCM 11303 / SMP-2) TaxID=502025 RepID=D0LYS5_HALO1|nr:ATP-binding protein [Haliangium ochraceum]ACY14395.1 PAS/PAC sensor signal transduction histidine kinase [Haliangium ochraceum DSM 14365]